MLGGGGIRGRKEAIYAYEKRPGPLFINTDYVAETCDGKRDKSLISQ